jgi:hypothetical protein
MAVLQSWLPDLAFLGATGLPVVYTGANETPGEATPLTSKTLTINHIALHSCLIPSCACAELHRPHPPLVQT